MATVGTIILHISRDDEINSSGLDSQYYVFFLFNLAELLLWWRWWRV